MPDFLYAYKQYEEDVLFKNGVFLLKSPYTGICVAGDEKWGVSTTAEGIMHRIKTKSVGARRRIEKYHWRLKNRCRF
jgi:hypothetical protein